MNVMKRQDPAFTVDKRDDIKDIISAMLKFHHKETNMITPSAFADTFTYEHDKDPKNTLIEMEAAKKAYEKNLITLTRMVEEAGLSEAETNSHH